jgi:hypothetical protein
MKKNFSGKNKTASTIISAILPIMGLIAASVCIAPVASASFANKDRVTDAFCLKYDFSSMSGSGQAFASTHDAQSTCQALVNEARKWTNLPVLLSNSAFMKGFLDYINTSNTSVVFSAQAQEVDPQLTVAGSCTNPDAATLQRWIARSQMGTEVIQTASFNITTKIFQYQLSQPHTCTYSATWDFSQFPAMQNGKDVSNCLLGIPYPANIQNQIGGVNPHHLAFQLNSYGGGVVDQQVFTNEQLLFTMKVPFPLQSVTAQLDTPTVAGQRVDIPAIYYLCGQGTPTVISATPTATSTIAPA